MSNSRSGVRRVRRTRRTRGFQGGRERAVIVRRAKCPPEIKERYNHNHNHNHSYSYRHRSAP